MTKQEIIARFIEIEDEVKELQERAENFGDGMSEHIAEEAEQAKFQFVVDNGIYFSNEEPYIRVK